MANSTDLDFIAYHQHHYKTNKTRNVKCCLKIKMLEPSDLFGTNSIHMATNLVLSHWLHFTPSHEIHVEGFSGQFTRRGNLSVWLAPVSHWLQGQETFLHLQAASSSPSGPLKKAWCFIHVQKPRKTSSGGMTTGENKRRKCWRV